MTPVTRNLAANLVAKLCTGLLTLGLVPIYAHLMGVEAYGLVGLFTTLQAVLLILDLGLSTTLNRELARLSASPDSAKEARDLVRTLELPYWALAGLILAVAWPVGVLVAGHWVRPESLPPEVVRKSLILMGMAVGLQFPSALYSGGLLGLQRQVLLSSVTVVTALLRGGGALVVLLFFDRSIVSFLLWQLVAAGIQTAATGGALWYALPGGGGRPRFRWALLEGKSGFAGGVFAVTMVTLFLTQADKILLSRVLTLEQFGYYAMATVTTGAFSAVIAPLFAAVFPRFSQLVAAGDEEAVRELYHKSTQAMSLFVLPVMSVMVFFSRDIMLLWTQNPASADRLYDLAAVLAVGSALNGVLHIPYGLQLAHGWTRLAFGVNLGCLGVLLPVLWFSTQHWGARGAAAGWTLVNVGALLFEVQLMHRRLLRGEQWRWYGADVALPLVAAVSVAGLVRLASLGVQGTVGKALAIGAAGAAALLAASLTAGRVRPVLWGYLRRPKSRVLGSSVP